MIVFGLQVLGQVTMILAMMGSFSSEIDYFNIGGFSVNKAKYLADE